MIKTIMGIDPSLTATGTAVLQGDKLIESSVLKNKLRDVERLHYIAEQVMNRCHIYKPDVIAIEGYAYGRSFKAAPLGELSGVLKYLFFINRWKFVVIPPTSMKEFITGTGQAKKELVMDILEVDYSFNFTDDNKADACALALYIKNKYNSDKNG